MKPLPLKKRLFAILSILIAVAGCGETLDNLIDPRAQKTASAKATRESETDYYEKFYKELASRAVIRKGTTEIQALDALPKDPSGEVNWTAAVMGGYINPRGSIDPGAEEEPILDLNIFIEAKVPLMFNVLFPHSIHTYWLSCNNCHPKIFIPEVGANPITMDEIFQGQWCGRCHGKVAFTFWPRDNCVRCHIVKKGESLERERWR
ncbi:MAG: cytochrome c3 family protein [Deltaproteobacteria bacterium]|nr:cytochrome c3 family protein [Deltaproteobacteria bacterium]MCL4874007.1 cytochrome c3 family protein [bacterium]